MEFIDSIKAVGNFVVGITNSSINSINYLSVDTTKLIKVLITKVFTTKESETDNFTKGFIETNSSTTKVCIEWVDYWFVYHFKKC